MLKCRRQIWDECAEAGMNVVIWMEYPGNTLPVFVSIDYYDVSHRHSENIYIIMVVIELWSLIQSNMYSVFIAIDEMSLLLFRFLIPTLGNMVISIKKGFFALIPYSTIVCVFTQTPNVFIMLFAFIDICINWITSFFLSCFHLHRDLLFFCVKSWNIPWEEGENCNTAPSYFFL